MMRQKESNRTPSSGDAAATEAVNAAVACRSESGRNGSARLDRAEYVPYAAPLSSETHSDYDVRDPMLAVLLDVQRQRTGTLSALYRVRALVAGGWR